jgi:hypothetical protein
MRGPNAECRNAERGNARARAGNGERRRTPKRKNTGKRLTLGCQSSAIWSAYLTEVEVRSFPMRYKIFDQWTGLKASERSSR